MQRSKVLVRTLALRTPIADQSLTGSAPGSDLASAIDETALPARIRGKAASHRAVAAEITCQNGLAIATRIDGAAGPFLSKSGRQACRHCGQQDRQARQTKCCITHCHGINPAVTGYCLHAIRTQPYCMSRKSGHQFNATCSSSLNISHFLRRTGIHFVGK